MKSLFGSKVLILKYCKINGARTILNVIETLWKVEVIPWIIADSNYVIPTSQKLDPTKTVFVGALHGKLTADGLAKIMNDLFDGVVYAGNFDFIIFWNYFIWIYLTAGGHLYIFEHFFYCHHKSLRNVSNPWIAISKLN